MPFQPDTPPSVPSAASGRFARRLLPPASASVPSVPAETSAAAPAVPAPPSAPPEAAPPVPPAADLPARRRPWVNPPSAPADPARRPDSSARQEARKKLREELSQVELTLVLEALGADPRQDGDPNKWKIAGFGNILVKGQSWKNANTERKGYGGVYLVHQALSLDSDAKAIEWMVEHFGETVSDDIRAAASGWTGPKDFSPPDAYPDAAEEVRRYLTVERGLPSSLIGEELAAGRIYASHPLDRQERPIRSIVHCVFVSSAAAEIRGTEPDGFKGCCTGSQTDLSGYRVGHVQAVGETLVALTEAAIDALSYRVLWPGRFTVSTNGAGRFLLQFKLAVESVSYGYGVRMAFDADDAGDLAAQRLFNAFYVRQALSHRLKVDVDTVEEWILEGLLEVLPENSPHELFLARVLKNGWSDALPVHHGSLKVDADGKPHMVWEPADPMETAAPTIRIKATKDLHPQLRRGVQTMTVSAKAYDYITQSLNVRRDRPTHAKDWNEELRGLGSAYLLDYESCAKAGFQRLPELPPALAAVRAPAPRMFVPPPPPPAESISPPPPAGRPLGFFRR